MHINTKMKCVYCLLLLYLSFKKRFQPIIIVTFFSLSIFRALYIIEWYTISLLIILTFIFSFFPRNYPWMCWKREKLWFDNYRRNWGMKRCLWYSSRRSDSRKSWLNRQRRLPKCPSSPPWVSPAISSAQVIKIVINNNNKTNMDIEGLPPWIHQIPRLEG